MALFDAWYTAIIVLDANVLLSLYRFAPDKSGELLEILEELSSKIWIPRQCYDEYRKHLPEIRGEIGEEYRTARGEFQRFRDKTKNRLFQLNSRNGLMIAQFIPGIDEFFQEIISSLLTHSKEHMSSLFKDDIDDRIARLIDGKIGDPFPQSRLDNIYIEGRFRYDNRIPPGFKDDNRKSEPDCYGDLVAWKQIIEFADEDKMKRPVIMVTDDSSGKDWFYKSNGEPRGPRHELVQELHDQAGVDFYLYTSEQFLWHARLYLKARALTEAAGEYFRRLTPTFLPNFGKIVATGSLSSLTANVGLFDDYKPMPSVLTGFTAGVSSKGLFDSVSGITGFSARYDHSFSSLEGLIVGANLEQLHNAISEVDAFSDRMEHLQSSLAGINRIADSIPPILEQQRLFQSVFAEPLRLSVPFIEQPSIVADAMKYSIPSVSDTIPSLSDVIRKSIPSVSDVARDLIPSVSDLIINPAFEAQQRRADATFKSIAKENQRRIDAMMKPARKQQRRVVDNIMKNLRS